MANRLVLVAGNIGTGKTSITERIGARLGWQTSYESVADNPYLPDFYTDMAQWSFHLQVFFLGHRAEQQARDQPPRVAGREADDVGVGGQQAEEPTRPRQVDQQAEHGEQRAGGDRQPSEFS